MKEKFDELAKGMAQSETRRGALKKLGAGIAGIALALVGFETDAKANPKPKHRFRCRCGLGDFGCDPNSPTYFECLDYCGNGTGRHQCGGSPAYRFLRRF